MRSIDVAEQFGHALDKDNFVAAKKLLAEDCTYLLAGNRMNGPEEIVGSYETNMLEGRKNLDELVWGESGVEEVEPNVFFIHFTDHIKHQGRSFIHRSKQRITVNEKHKISEIEHIHDVAEEKRLQDFFDELGIG